jgi:hypothetical protein
MDEGYEVMGWTRDVSMVGGSRLDGALSMVLCASLVFSLVGRFWRRFGSVGVCYEFQERRCCHFGVLCGLRGLF